MSKLSGLIVSAVACVIGCGTVSTGVQAAAPPDALKIIIGGTTYLDFTAANEQQQAISKLQFAPLLDGFKAGTIFLIEPKGETGSTIQTFEGNDVSRKNYSDALSLNGSQLAGKINVFFVSDGAAKTDLDNFPIFATTMNVDETGKPQDVSAFFGLVKGSIVITSDVPELATWAMMLLGFGLVALRLRSRSPATAA